MKKVLVVFCVVILSFSFISAFSLKGLFSSSITGDTIGDSEMMHEERIGPSAEDMACLEACIIIGCEPGDVECMIANSEKCEQECGVEAEPEPANEGEACMQKCVVVGCDNHDFNCQNANMKKCEKECDMIGEPEAQSEEEQCIRDCINKIDPNIQCSSGTFEGEGETGGAVCQKCADECVHLYSGPCLSDEERTEKENECYSQCEHCYGEPVMGPSGQGYECTIDIKCADASGEFGDDAGTGDNSYEKGHESPGIVEAVTETIGTITGGIANFFKNIFGGGKKVEETEDNLEKSEEVEETGEKLEGELEKTEEFKESEKFEKYSGEHSEEFREFEKYPEEHFEEYSEEYQGEFEEYPK